MSTQQYKSCQLLHCLGSEVQNMGWTIQDEIIEVWELLILWALYYNTQTQLQSPSQILSTKVLSNLSR